MRIGQKTHVEHQVRIRGNAVAKSEAHHGNQQRPPPRILKAVNDELAQLVNVEFGGVNDDIRETPDRRHPPPLQADSFGDGIIGTERMRTARFAEPPHQRFVARFDEHERRGMFGGELAVNPGQLFDLLAFARVHEQSRAFHFAHAFDVEFAEFGNQADRQIIDAIKSQVFERIQDGTFAGTGKAGEKNQLAGVAIWRVSGRAARHGGLLTLHPAAVRAGDAQVLAIFCDGAARHLNSFFAEFLGDLLVGQADARCLRPRSFSSRGASAKAETSRYPAAHSPIR